MPDVGATASSSQQLPTCARGGGQAQGPAGHTPAWGPGLARPTADTPLPLFLTETLKSSSHQRPSRWSKWKRVGSPSPGAPPKAQPPGRCWTAMLSPTRPRTAPTAARTSWTGAALCTSSGPWRLAGPTTSPSSRSSATPTTRTTSAGPSCCSPARVSDAALQRAPSRVPAGRAPPLEERDGDRVREGAGECRVPEEVLGLPWGEAGASLQAGAEAAIRQQGGRLGVLP